MPEATAPASPPATYTAFAADRLLATGTPTQVSRAVGKALRTGAAGVLVFDDQTGRQIEIDLRRAEEDLLPRAEGKATPQEPAPRSAGRPKLGVVSREVTLLPRQWEWLAAQPGGASATLRKLVDVARKADAPAHAARQAQQASDRFMMTMLGNQPGYEEAARALYAGDAARYHAFTESWPADLRDHARRLAAPAFRTDADTGTAQ